jgi:hypothetical protein
MKGQESDRLSQNFEARPIYSTSLQVKPIGGIFFPGEYICITWYNIKLNCSHNGSML